MLKAFWFIAYVNDIKNTLYKRLFRIPNCACYGRLELKFEYLKVCSILFPKHCSDSSYLFSHRNLFPSWQCCDYICNYSTKTKAWQLHANQRIPIEIVFYTLLTSLTTIKLLHFYVKPNQIFAEGKEPHQSFQIEHPVHHIILWWEFWKIICKEQ